MTAEATASRQACPWAVWSFPLLMGLISRLLILGVMGHASGGPFHWSLLQPWDGGWYAKIATTGYDFGPDDHQHSIAFFPVFPLMMRAVMRLGALPAMAGVLLNNLAFGAALLLVYRWSLERFGAGAARWICAVLAWCPFSVFGSIVYTEGLFLLWTTAALYAFDRRRYALAGLLAALASGTRVMGAPLALSMLLAAWKEKRSPAAYTAAVTGSAGLVAFVWYCAWRFGHPFAFIEAQRGWRTHLGFDWQSWERILSFGLLGPMPWNGLLMLVMILGGGVLLWHMRQSLSVAETSYGLVGLALIVSSGSVTSIDRYAYGLIPLSVALGLLLYRHPRWGYLVMLCLSLMLASYSQRLAQGLWVA